MVAVLPAPVMQVDTRRKHLQLLYADMTEECVSDRDFDDMLTNGHLMDVQDVYTPSTGGLALRHAVLCCAELSSIVQLM